ncbi:MFS transporter [Acetobacteraceae bacterium KSS8]|uniref:MFS transporter n=1 Tax=Endosaccharibacter trunci TaxID=2812733 RepID=A0ABT1W9L1_9PROT|nr:MFS transporter [Acetobacteraceae bacterium KSS8]
MTASREPIDRLSPLYPRLRASLFLAGFATFALLYCVQPLLTVFGDDFHVSAANASLALSLSTGFLAFSIVGTTPLAVRFGRKRVMCVSVISAAVCNLCVAMAPGWTVLLILRAIEGILLGGVPAVAMAHLADEIAPAELGPTMGLYIAGTAIGGFGGRVGIALVSEWGGWRTGMLVTGLVCLAAAVAFTLLLPPARTDHRVEAGRPRAAPGSSGWVWHLRDGGMLTLFFVGFLGMSCFVTSYNYLGFRLLRPPFSLGQAASGAVFAVYPVGIVASPIAGRLAGRFGPGPVLAAGPCFGLLGLGLALLPSLPAIMLGLALITAGFFVSHSVASAWVGQRATRDRGHASALYLLWYYVGSSIMGTVGGWFWSRGAWPGVTAFCAGLLLLALIAALALWRIPARGAAPER